MAIAIAIDGFSGFLLAVVFGVLGLAIGAYLDGDLDPSQLKRGQRE